VNFDGKKAAIFDLDNTLYPHSKEFSALLDAVMAQVLVEEFGVPLSFEEALAKVHQSYHDYRDGGELFYREYGVDKQKFYHAYHDYEIKHAVDKIVPTVGLAEKLAQVKMAQFVFTYSSLKACEHILRHLGLYEIFKGRFYSVEDFGILSKNDGTRVYKMLCERIGFAPSECIFVDDSYSNLEYPKELGMATVRIYYSDNASGDKDYIDAAYRGVGAFLDECIEKGR
jgi:pyrimidine 5'-nucleotidase